MPWHQVGSPVPSTPAMSRITPSVTSAATPRLAMRAVRMSPKMPASVTPMASTTAMQPSGIVLDGGAGGARRRPGLRASRGPRAPARSAS